MVDSVNAWVRDRRELHCEKVCVPALPFDNTNVTCMHCEKFHCTDCTSQIWTGQWMDSVFYKPTIVLPGMRHEVFRCAFCRASFDRIVKVDTQHDGSDDKK